MNIMATLKGKKPWFLPKWVWNLVVNQACDAVKENLKIEAIARFASDVAMNRLGDAVNGKDPDTVKLVATAVAGGGQVFVEAGKAVTDGVVTDEEKTRVGEALATTIVALIPQEQVEAEIEKLRATLLAE